VAKIGNVSSVANPTFSDRFGKFLPIVRVLVVVVIAILPFIGLDQFWTRQVVLVALMALTVSGLSLIFGYAGQLNLGQPAMYAAGAYAAGYFSKNLVNDLLINLAIGILFAVVVGVIVGLPGLRTSGWSLSILSFFLVLLVVPVVNIIGAPIGGFAGLTGIPIPAQFGIELDNNMFYIFVVAITALWFFLMLNLIKSRHGRALLVVKESTVLASSLGIPPFATKLKVYAISAIPSGIAGVFFAYLDGYVAPDSFGLNLGVTILAALVLGGAVSVYGPLIGAAFIVIVPSQLNSFDKYNAIVYGVLLVASGIFFNNGIVGLWNWLMRRLFKSRRKPETDLSVDFSEVKKERPQLEHVDGLRLELTNVNKRFGGNQALKGVTAVAEPGQITALIGPNGSGKTTLLNLISGFYKPDEGSTVLIGGKDATGLPVHKVSQLGVGRTFQTPIIPAGLTAREVVAAANFDRHRSTIASSVLHLPSYRRARRSDAEVDGVMESMGLASIANEPASSLALGTRRMVELARTVAGANKLILLDEVAAGLDEEEIVELGIMIRALRDSGATVILVEHNFTFVQELADHVLVLAEGALVADGAPEYVANHPEVLRQYLGEGAAVTGTRTQKSKDGDKK